MIYKLRKDSTHHLSNGTYNSLLNTTVGPLEETSRKLNVNDSKSQIILLETTTTNGDTKTYQLKSPESQELKQPPN